MQMMLDKGESDSLRYNSYEPPKGFTKSNFKSVLLSKVIKDHLNSGGTFTLFPETSIPEIEERMKAAGLI